MIGMMNTVYLTSVASILNPVAIQNVLIVRCPVILEFPWAMLQVIHKIHFHFFLDIFVT